MSGVESTDREHESLELRIDRLWALLLAPAHVLSRSRWRRLLRFEVDRLRDALETHFANEERGGFFVELVESHPNLSPQIAALAEEHVAIRGDLASLASAEVSLEKLKSRLKALVTAVNRHEERENELLQGALLTDIGGGD